MEMRARIAGMRRFDKTYRLQGDSLQAIAGALDEFAVRIAGEIKYKKRKIKSGPFLNALVLWFLSHDEAERKRIAKDAVARLEAFMAGEDGESPRADLPAPSPVAHSRPEKPARKQA